MKYDKDLLELKDFNIWFQRFGEIIFRVNFLFQIYFELNLSSKIKCFYNKFWMYKFYENEISH